VLLKDYRRIQLQLWSLGVRGRHNCSVKPLHGGRPVRKALSVGAKVVAVGACGRKAAAVWKKVEVAVWACEPRIRIGWRVFRRRVCIGRTVADAVVIGAAVKTGPTKAAHWSSVGRCRHRGGRHQAASRQKQDFEQRRDISNFGHARRSRCRPRAISCNVHGSKHRDTLVSGTALLKYTIPLIGMRTLELSSTSDCWLTSALPPRANLKIAIAEYLLMANSERLD
jgi:hypothetical protein